MNRTLGFAWTVAALVAMGPLAAAEEPAVHTRQGQTVSLAAADGVKLYADLYAPHARSAAFILLFHQAGSEARGEYGPLIPRLLDRGFNVMAIDQRSGGSRFGQENRTVAGLAGREFGYCEVYPDLEAALGYAVEHGYGKRRAVWGSSYSAALVLRLAAEHPASVQAVLAFSPATGGPMAECRGEPYAERIKAPVLVLRPGSEMALESSRTQFANLAALGIETHVAPAGVHGSSMLNRDRSAGDVEPTWDVVLAFLAKAIGQP